MITNSRTPGLPKDDPRRAPLPPPSGSRRRLLYRGEAQPSRHGARSVELRALNVGGPRHADFSFCSRRIGAAERITRPLSSSSFNGRIENGVDALVRPHAAERVRPSQSGAKRMDGRVFQRAGIVRPRERRWPPRSLARFLAGA